MIDLSLPMPPSLNNYYRRVGPKVLISAQGRRYRAAVAMLVRSKQIQRLDGRLRMSIRVHAPDRRRRDLDNVLKALWDALQHAGVYADDGNIDTLLVQREDIKEGGMVRVNIQEINRG